MSTELTLADLVKEGIEEHLSYIDRNKRIDTLDNKIKELEKERDDLNSKPHGWGFTPKWQRTIGLLIEAGVKEKMEEREKPI